MATIRFNAYSVRRIDNPNSTDLSLFGEEIKDFKYFILLVSIFQVPDELKNWREINPRQPNSDNAVSRAIAKTLQDPKAHKAFFLRNRGMTILAEDLIYDNQTGQIDLVLSDPLSHGLLDGGHTFEVIREYLSDNPSGYDSYVKIEVFTKGDLVDDVTEITGGRNRSTNVPELGLVNHQGKLDKIKTSIASFDYSSKIAWKQYEVDEQGNDKPINGIDILAYLACFDIFNYPNFDKNPVFVYSTKGIIPKKFNDDKYCENIDKITHLLPDILQLHDWIVRDIPELWKGEEAKNGYNQLTEVRDANGKATDTFFIGDKSSAYVTNAYTYPILAAFRSLITLDNATGTYKWRYDLQTFYDRVKSKLVHDLKTYRKQNNSVNQLGKDTTLWSACYKTAKMEIFEMQQEEGII